MEQFRRRPLEATYAFFLLDAVNLNVRQNHRFINKGAVLAIGAGDTRELEILDFSIGVSEEATSWQESLRALARRNLKRVWLVISDARMHVCSIDTPSEMPVFRRVCSTSKSA